jgi:hypothetical protein
MPDLQKLIAFREYAAAQKHINEGKKYLRSSFPEMKAVGKTIIDAGKSIATNAESIYPGVRREIAALEKEAKPSIFKSLTEAFKNFYPTKTRR